MLSIIEKNKSSNKLSSFFMLLSSKQKGFSLMEMMVTMFIFCLMMLAVVAIFSSIISARRSTLQNQKDMEAVRNAMALMAKHLRMSKQAGPAGETLEVRMYSDNKCVYYKFESGKLKNCVKNAINPYDCDSCPAANYMDIISQNVSGKFSVIGTDNTLGSEHIGRATILMKVGSSGKEKYLQTTVSFRDYEGIIQ